MKRLSLKCRSEELKSVPRFIMWQTSWMVKVSQSLFCTFILLSTDVMCNICCLQSWTIGHFKPKLAKESELCFTFFRMDVTDSGMAFLGCEYDKTFWHFVRSFNSKLQSQWVISINIIIISKMVFKNNFAQKITYLLHNYSKVYSNTVQLVEIVIINSQSSISIRKGWRKSQ